jgi:hypothetical protein
MSFTVKKRGGAVAGIANVPSSWCSIAEFSGESEQLIAKISRRFDTDFARRAHARYE